MPSRTHKKPRIQTLPASFLSLLSETQPGTVAAHLVDDVLALEEDVTKDAEAIKTRGRLDTTKARAVAVGGKVDVLSGDGLLDAVDEDGEVGERAAAGEGNTSGLGVVLGTVDLRVVGVDDGVIDVDEGCAGVGNGVDAGAGGGGANAVAVGSEAPETLAVVDIDIGNGAGVLALVDVTKVISTSSVVLEVDSEQRLSKLRLDSVEESGLLHRLDGVDRAHGETQKTISAGILSELGRNGRGGLDSLGLGRNGTNSD